MPDKFGTVWTLLIVILLIYLITGKDKKLSTAWKALTGQVVIDPSKVG